MVLEHFPFGRIQQCLAIGQSRIRRKSGQVAQKTALQVVRNLDEFIDHPPAKLVMGEPVVRRDPEVIDAPAAQASPGQCFSSVMKPISHVAKGTPGMTCRPICCNADGFMDKFRLVRTYSLYKRSTMQ